MVSAMFDEEFKVEAANVKTIYAMVGTTHEAICDLAAMNDQEEDKVLEYFFYENIH